MPGLKFICVNKTKCVKYLKKHNIRLLLDIQGIVWLEEVEDKIYKKHRVASWEVEEALASVFRIRFVEKGTRKDEDLYAAMGRTKAGRYLIVFFIQKKSGDALIISARDMTQKERKTYAKEKK